MSLHPPRKTGGPSAPEPLPSDQKVSFLPVPGSEKLPASAKNAPAVGGPTAKELVERASRTHILHAVGNAILNCGKGIAGLICSVGCVAGGVIAVYSQVFTVVAYAVGSYAFIPGGAIGLVLGTFVGKPFQGAKKGAEIGYDVGGAALAIPTAIALSIPYLVGSSLLKASAKGVEKTIGISEGAKEFIRFILFVEYRVDWEKVKQGLPDAFRLLT